MINIAICDDDTRQLSEIVGIIKKFEKLHINQQQINIKLFGNGTDLISDIEKGSRYHIVLLDIIRGSLMIFPEWIETILMPGYLLGFALGYVGGVVWAMVGQSVELIIIFFLVRMIYKPIRRKIYKDEQK